MSEYVVQPESTRGYTAAEQRDDRPHEPSTTRASRAFPEPSHDDIARRAYDIYDRTGRVQGRCRQNWYQAERELRRNNR